ncbi:hypothetical protein B0H14DRAFT_2749919 [Mycena olivaceomarginata]|nr:hypothetical protein B0H14DRAFT_2749919 [Mycena olivaceomarginata]
MSSNSNQQKIDAYNDLSPEARAAQHQAHITRVLDWITGDAPPRTCEQALDLVQRVPPVKLGGESCKTKDMSQTERAFVRRLRHVKLVSDWMDNVVAAVDFRPVLVNRSQRFDMTSMWTADRAQPRGPDRVEKTVDEFHKAFVLDPAAAIAGIMMAREIEVTYAPQTDGSATYLRVGDKQDTAGAARNYIVAEDKRGRVWLEHESGVLELLKAETVPSYNKEDDPKPEPPVRICVQIYIQMHKFQAFYGKIFSPCGVVYVRRGALEDELEFSRIYHDLDGDVRRTACLIIEAQRRPRGQYGMSVPGSVRSISEIWPFRVISAWFYRQALQLLLQFQTFCGTPTVAVGQLESLWFLYKALSPWPPLKFPMIFSTHLGAGASGDVWLSNDRNYVIKLFLNRDVAEHEADILLKCQDHLGLAVATFHGLYSDGWRFGVVTRFMGSAIGPLDHAPLDQRQQLLTALHKLHSCGIHHHDVRPANIMVDNSGAVTLIDFDRAEEVYGECKGCSDLEVISSLETSIRKADPEPEIGSYL